MGDLSVRLDELERENARLREELRARASEEPVHAALHAARVGTWSLDLTTERCTWNDEMGVLFGLPRGTALGSWHEFLNHVVPDDRDGLVKALGQIRQGRHEYAVEFRVRWPDGQVRWLRGQGERLEAGTRLTGVAIDITGRVEAELALRASEERLLLAADGAGLAIWDIDLQRETLAWLGNWRRPYGIPEGGAPPSFHSWTSFLHPDDHDRIVAALRAALEPDADAYQEEFRVVGEDGAIRWLMGLARVTRDADGRALRLVGVNGDITARKAIEQALLASEEMHRRLFEEIPVAAFVYDVQTLRHLSLNRAAVRQYGYSRAEFLALTVLDLAHKQELPAVLASITADEEPRRYPRSWRQYRKDGSVVEVEIISHAVQVQGAAARLVLAPEVGEQRRMEQRLQQMQRLESLGLLAGGVAHTFNNLLTAIVGHGELVRQDLLPADPRREQMDGLLSSARRAADLARQLLAVGRRQLLRPRTLVISDLVASLQPLLGEILGVRTRLEVQAEEGVPAVHADASQLDQVLVALVTNAREAMPEGGTARIETRVVELTAEDQRRLPALRPGPHVVLTVADTGHGMDEATLARALEPFFTTRPKGTGLGLSTSLGIVRQSGGHLELESEQGKGTRCSVYLPVAGAARAAAAGSAPVTHHAAGDETVLVVEDEPEVRHAVRTTLERAGYRVLGAADAEEGLALYHRTETEVDLVLTDVTMPGMDGFALARELRAARPDVPLLVMSGHLGAAGAGDDALPGGAVFLPKPFGPAELLRAVRHVLDGA